MALMDDQKIDKRSKEYKQMVANNNSNENTAEPVVVEQNVQANSTDPRDLIIQQMQKQMQMMEERINSVDRPKTDREAASKHYDWPRTYNYRLWNGKPICGAVTKKNDSTKQLVDKNKHGQYESNHMLVLTHHDDSTSEVEVTDFNANFERSEKIEADTVTDPRDSRKVLGYKFHTENFWTFTVIPGMIN